MPHVELLHRLRMLGGDMAVADVFANDRPILALYQGIVLAAIGSALGELDQQILEQLRHFVVDVFRPVVGMKAQNPERKLVQHGFQHRD